MNDKATKRAKQVLDECAHELENVPIWARANLEMSIAYALQEYAKISNGGHSGASNRESNMLSKVREVQKIMRELESLLSNLKLL